MHRKRVTFEMHDSYFRLMTIKHTIPKILSGRLNYYITWWRQEVSSLEIRPVGEKMLEWKHVLERLGPLAPGWAAQENENDTQRCSEGLWKSICWSLCSVSNFVSHATFQIKWEIYFLKKSSLVFIIASMCILHVYVYIYAYLSYVTYNIRISKDLVHYNDEATLLITCSVAGTLWIFIWQGIFLS